MGYHDSVTSRKSLFLFYNPSISFSLSGQLVDVIERQGHLLTVRQAGQPGVYELENGDHFQSSPLQWQVHRRSRKVEAHQSDRATAILRNKLPIVSGIHKKKKEKRKKRKKELLPTFCILRYFPRQSSTKRPIVRYAAQFHVSVFLEAVFLGKSGCLTMRTASLG